MEENQEINELLLKFLDADTLEEKYDILCEMGYDGITDSLIDNMAASLDEVIPDGVIDMRYESLKRCIRTKQKYEVSRFGRR
ncbi:MAG: hypothetical protein IIZ61_09840 [Lachnospiraceae bacterium]|nr:hypothetical protein [Lachnospiraceae bacterium]